MTAPDDNPLALVSLDDLCDEIVRRSDQSVILTRTMNHPDGDAWSTHEGCAFTCIGMAHTFIDRLTRDLNDSCRHDCDEMGT